MEKGKVSLVPEPKKIEFGDKYFEFDGFSDLPEFLQTEFKIPRGNWKCEKIDKKGTGFRIIDGKVQFWGNEYVVYASLVQLMKQNEGLLPEMEVEESFNFEFRGYHLDIARGGVPTLQTFKKILRWLFLLKYNYFAIYFEDLFPWEKHPDIGKYRGRLTKEELGEIISYGRKLGIEVFPSLELTGHMEHILSLPNYRRFSEWYRPTEGCLNLADEDARKFSMGLLEEVLDFFPSKYVHIGGDETWALGRGKSLNNRWRFEGHKLYERHYKEMIKLVHSYGKKAIMWGDMLTGMYLSEEESEKWRETLESNIWDEVILANWDYSKNQKEFFKKKINVFGEKRKSSEIVCPGLSNWNTYYPNFQIALENLKNFLGAAKEESITGFLVTAWGDDGAECLFSYLDPLILTTMEIAEGKEKWEDKWKALTDENEKIISVRKTFGEPAVSLSLKHVLFADLWYHLYGNEKAEDELKTKWSEILDEADGVNLPEDLWFIREAVRTGLNRLNHTVRASDFIELASIYSRLWLSERKPEGLEKILTRFWGAAGVIDTLQGNP